MSLPRAARALAAAVALAAGAGPAAGHGMSTAFATIEWLPEPGRTPDDLGYFLDGWRESRALDGAESRGEAVELALRFAREKLAEVEATLREGEGDAAAQAAGRYRELVARALASLDEAAGAGAADEAQRLSRTVCQALLEHQYILSVDYEELPSPGRRLLVDIVASADAAYRSAAAHRAPRDREAFFFKENEVRWSVRAGMPLEERGGDAEAR